MGTSYKARWDSSRNAFQMNELEALPEDQIKLVKKITSEIEAQSGIKPLKTCFNFLVLFVLSVFSYSLGFLLIFYSYEV